MSKLIVPSDFLDLLERVNAELTRRDGNGSLKSYAGITFDRTPQVGNTIDYEHADKVFDGLSLINTSGLPSEISKFISEEDMEMMDVRLTANEAQPRGATSNNDCAAACSGMCVSQCTTSCGGSCTGTCSSGCSGGCKGCGGSCSYGCSGCSGSCTGSCKGDCNTTCTGTCSGSCSGSCSGGCTNNCKGCGPCTGCQGVCTGCGSGCASSCSGSCTGGCTRSSALIGN